MYLFLINGLRGGGAERVLQVLANHYAKDSKPVVILTLEEPGSDFLFDPRVTIRQLIWAPSWGWLRNWLLPLQWLALCLWVRLLKPTFCFSLLARSNFLNVLSGLVTGVRTPISEHIHSVEEFSGGGVRNWGAIWLIRRLYPLASDIFCVSHGVKDCLVGLGVSHPQMVVMPNPIDLSQAATRTAVEKDPSTIRIITVGRLTPQKDHHTLIHAFAEICQSRPLELHIVGDGPLRDDLGELVSQLGLDRQIHMLGWVENVFVHLNGADIFVLSSRWEGFGNVLVEAMACGLPVVGTDCDSGPGEILGSGRFGILVPVGDVQALARALTQLIESSELREHYAKLGQQRALDYSVDKIARRYEQLLLAGRPE